MGLVASLSANFGRCGEKETFEACQGGYDVLEWVSKNMVRDEPILRQ
jgi:hypothetical protein